MEADSKIVKSLITPNGKTIHEVFQNKERYYIDIYQRDYKWEKSQVDTLLKDIELRFNLTERRLLDPKLIKKDVLDRFSPYFLNTYLTCKTSNSISIVDGQQRLTTLLIMFIKLRRMVDCINESPDYGVKTISTATLNNLIFEADDFSNPEYYKIFNTNRQSAFDAILNEDYFGYTPNDESQNKIIENYKIISQYYDKLFKIDSEQAAVDVVKLTYYIYYILEKLNIVEIKIEHKENVATIFEVVNDRGMGLKSYEILKGKFIGNLSDEQKETANNIWVDLQDKYYNTTIKNTSETRVDLDSFFKIYFRAKFADSESEYEKFENKYHYEIYQTEKILNHFERFENNEKLFSWVCSEFKYFADLLLNIRTQYSNEYLIFNKLLDQNQQYLLIVSSITFNDPLKDQKIEFVAKKFDQFHTILRLMGEYDSNKFQKLIYRLNKDIRNKSINEIENVFDKTLLEFLETDQIIQPNIYNKISELFKWEILQNANNKWGNFSKYILMRIDRYLSKVLDKPSYCNEALSGLEERFNKNNLKRYGMHLEHIFAFNDKNRLLFIDAQGVFDENRYNSIRNKLGMVLLLKDKQNISSNNDYYQEKMDDYATSNIIWNELLVGHMDSIDRRNLPPSINFTKIDPTVDGVFPLDKVEIRQKETVDMIKLIWGF